MALCQLTESGLEPDGVEAALVPFKGEVTAMPMFQGLAKLLYSSGLVRDVYADVFYEGEVKTGRFRYRKGSTPEIHHEPIIGSEAERGNPLGAYAVVHLQTGGLLVDVMNADEIEERRAVSRSADNDKGPWKNWPLEMWKKTVFRRLAKTAPKSDQLRKALAIDSTDFDVEAQVVSREPAQARSGTSGLKATLGQLAPPTQKVTVEDVVGKPRETVPVQRAAPKDAEKKRAAPAPAAKEAPKTAAAAPAEPEPPRAPDLGQDDGAVPFDPPESSEDLFPGDR